jgi:hypothetical protein
MLIRIKLILDIFFPYDKYTKFFPNTKIFITMNLDVDFLIDFFNKYSGEKSKEEMGEQEAAAAPSSPSSGGGSVPKWSDSYQTKRGKANPLTKSGEKWNTGLTRGSANQIW